MKTPVHVLAVDYSRPRREELRKLLEKQKMVCHAVASRTEALGRLWELASAGTFPRAIVANWLLDEPKAREFFSAIGREIDHTSLSLLRNVVRIDQANDAPHKTIIICYAETDELASEAENELSDDQLLEKVALTVYDPIEGFDGVVDLLVSDERTKIMNLVKTERILRGQAALACSSSSESPRRLSR